MSWSKQQVHALSPDSASLSAGEKLSNASKWQTLGQQSDTLWGEIKGSGSKPYQVCIDLIEPAFKCSCPSRKFPCKHGLGLALIYASQSISAAPPPVWVQEWLDKRLQRTETKKAKNDTPADPATQAKQQEAQAKRLQSREKKIAAGVQELQRFLFDQLRQGLAQQDDDEKWETMAARMIDAQASGLARRLEDCFSLRYQTQSSSAWQETLLERIGKLYLLLSAYQHIEHFSADLQAEIQTQIGFTHNKEALLLQKGLTDTWHVLGYVKEDDGRLVTQRIWLYGEHSQKWALLLDFSIKNQNQTLPFPAATGQSINAELVFYPSHAPLRAVLKTALGTHPVSDTASAFMSIPQALQSYTNALSKQPWLMRYPIALQDVVLVAHENNWYLTQTEQAIRLHLAEENAWRLLALSGGHSIKVMGEWNGEHLKLCSVLVAGVMYDLTGVDWLVQ